MFLKKISLGVLIMCISGIVLAEQKSGESLFKTMCVSCHSVESENGIAPPVFGIINHTKKAYPYRDDFIERIVDWVSEPDASQSIMPSAVMRFGLMPKLPYSESDVSIIAEYLFDGLLLPEWYQEHHKMEHGSH